MNAPSWSEFDRKTSNFEKEIDKKVQSLKNNHPLLDRVLKQSLSLLPAPFNTYAQTIYETVAGSPVAKSSQVLDYINTVKSKGEGYYYSERWEDDYKTKLEAVTRQLQVGVNTWTKNIVDDQLRQLAELQKQLELSLGNQNLSSSAMTWFSKGLEFANLGQNENAIACFKKAIEINPRFVEAWNNLGVIFQSRGNYKMALEFYENALTINPNFILAQRNKAILHNLILTHTSNQPMTDDEQKGIKHYTADGKPVYE